MSNTVRSIALVALLILLAAPFAAPAMTAPMARGSSSLAAPSADSTAVGLLTRGPAQDPNGAPLRGPAQDPNGGLPAPRIVRGPAQDPNGGRPDRTEWGGSVASGLSQQSVIARLLSV